MIEALVVFGALLEVYVLLGLYAGILAAVAGVAGWTTFFAPQCVGGDDNDRSHRALVMPAAILLTIMITVAVTAARWTAMAWFLSTAVGAIIVAMIACIAIAILTPIRRKGALVFSTGLYVLLTVPVVAAFSKIAYGMWNKKIDVGVPSYQAASYLAGIHVLFIAFCLALTVILWVRRPKRNPRAARISAVASVVFVTCISMAFFFTVPRAGDEWLFFWLLIVPAFALAVLVLFVTCVIALIGSAVQLRAQQIGGSGKGEVGRSV